MQVTETQAEGLKRAYTVVVTASELDDKIVGRLEELSGKVNIPGFRPGKAPMKILRQRFGPAVRGEVLERAVNDSSSQALDERNLRPAGQPKIEIVSADEGKDLEFSLELEILPEIEPMDFATLELERVKIPVSDHEVDETLQRLAENNKTTRELAEPRGAENGDVVVLDFKGTVDGEAKPGMEGEDHHLELGSSTFIAGFEDQLTGAEVGQDRTVTVTFPDEYVNDELAGKEAVFQCQIKQILESVPGEIDDSLAEALGEESLATLKEKVRAQIENDYGQIGRERMKRAMLDKLAAGHDFPIPEGMVEAEFETIWKQIEADRERGVTDPDDEGKDEEALRAEYREIALRRVKLGLLLSEVGRLNKIEVSQEEVNSGIMREAMRWRGQEQEVFKFYSENPEAQSQIRAPLFEEKVVDFIAELAQVTEREVSFDDLKAEEEAEAAAKAPAKAASGSGEANEGAAEQAAEQSESKES